jgi:hypothetical protein
MLKKYIFICIITLSGLATLNNFSSCATLNNTAYADSSKEMPLKQLSDKDSKFQEDAAKQLNKLAQGVNDSFKENKDWFTSFIDKLKNQHFFKNISDFFVDIFKWFAKIFRNIADALQPQSWKKYIEDIENTIRK